MRTLLLVVPLFLALPAAGSPLPEECPTERPPTAGELGQLPWLAEHPFGSVIAVPAPSAVWSGHLVRLARGERLSVAVDALACMVLSVHPREGTGWGAPVATGAGRRGADGTTVRVVLETDVTRAGTYLVVVGSPSGHAVPRSVHVSCTRGACRGYARCRPLDNRYEPLQVGALLRKPPEAPPFLVRLEGTVRAASTVSCTQQACAAEECCQSCTQGLGFRSASGFLRLSSLRCDGDNCNPGRRCDIAPGSRAVVWGLAPADRYDAFEVAGACSQHKPQVPLP